MRRAPLCDGDTHNICLAMNRQMCDAVGKSLAHPGAPLPRMYVFGSLKVGR